MASYITEQMRNMSKVETANAIGDMTRKNTENEQVVFLQIKDVINTKIEQLSS